ncbi:hypothetical protein ABKV19_013150, partial [Rosa sericea]
VVFRYVVDGVSTDSYKVAEFPENVKSGDPCICFCHDNSGTADHLRVYAHPNFICVLPRYFSSEWSVAKFHLQEGLHHIVAFGKRKNTIMIIGMDG